MRKRHVTDILLFTQITGVASDAEFQDYLPAAGDFRAVAPMCAAPADYVMAMPCDACR
jgi:hypothetical protein